jgi:hypothetical protein
MNCNAGYCEFSLAPPGTARALGVIFHISLPGVRHRCLPKVLMSENLAHTGGSMMSAPTSARRGKVRDKARV